MNFSAAIQKNLNKYEIHMLRKEKNRKMLGNVTNVTDVILIIW